jgi:hypothetical protein
MTKTFKYSVIAGLLANFIFALTFCGLQFLDMKNQEDIRIAMIKSTIRAFDEAECKEGADNWRHEIFSDDALVTIRGRDKFFKDCMARKEVG